MALRQGLDSVVHDRLVIWSKWAVKFEKPELGLGYPSKSTFANLDIPRSEECKSKPPYPIEEIEACEMNGWINRMSQDHPDYRVVIYEFYLRKNGDRIKEIAKKLAIAERNFKVKLREARIWLEGFISKLDQNKH